MYSDHLIPRDIESRYADQTPPKGVKRDLLVVNVPIGSRSLPRQVEKPERIGHTSRRYLEIFHCSEHHEERIRMCGAYEVIPRTNAK